MNKEERPLQNTEVLQRKDTDLIFAVYQNIEKPNYIWLYRDLLKSFQITLDRVVKVVERMVMNDEDDNSSFF